MAPDPIDYCVLAAVTIGTSLAAASANAINQYIEAQFLLTFTCFFSSFFFCPLVLLLEYSEMLFFHFFLFGCSIQLPIRNFFCLLCICCN